jgi:hypothetical protein
MGCELSGHVNPLGYLHFVNWHPKTLVVASLIVLLQIGYSGQLRSVSPHTIKIRISLGGLTSRGTKQRHVPPAICSKYLRNFSILPGSVAHLDQQWRVVRVAGVAVVQYCFELIDLQAMFNVFLRYNSATRLLCPYAISPASRRSKLSH